MDADVAVTTPVGLKVVGNFSKDNKVAEPRSEPLLIRVTEVVPENRTGV